MRFQPPIIDGGTDGPGRAHPTCKCKDRAQHRLAKASIPEQQQQTQLTEAFSRLEVSPWAVQLATINASIRSTLEGQDHASPNPDAHSLAKSSAPYEESKGDRVKLMCPHCRELFLPAALEQHK